MGNGAGLRDCLRGLHVSLCFSLVCFGVLQPPFIVRAETASTESDVGVLSPDIPAATGSVTVTRSLPELFAFPGQVAASLAVDVDETDFPTMLTIEEDIPARWTVAEASPPYDAFDGDVVTWVFEGEAASDDRIIAYSLDVPADYCNEGAAFGGRFRYLFGGFQYTVPIGGDNSMVSDDLCVGIKDLSPDLGLPGDEVEFSGYCYYYHSGRSGDLYFDGEYLVTTSGDTFGNFSGVFAVPQDATPGEHLVSCESCTCSGVFLVVTPTVTQTPTPRLTPTLTPTPTSNRPYLIAVAEASPNPATSGETVTLDGTQSYFTNNSGSIDDITGWQWEQIGGSPAVEITDATASIATLVAPLVGEETALEFQLRVEADGMCGSPPAPCVGITSISVTILPAQPTPTPTPMLGDINRDGRIDELDLYLLLQEWHQPREQ
jgi:hypothetical protein